MTSTERSRASRAGKTRKVIAAAPPPEPKPLPAPKVRKARSDSASSAIVAMSNAALPQLMPPVHVSLTEKAMYFWGGIVESRARDAWTTAELVTAAALANVQARIEEEEYLIEAEGSITTDIMGKDQINPRAKLVEIYHKRALALMRTLRMGGTAAGDPADLVKGRTLEGNARKMMQDEDDPHGLLA